jgi:hypothetical protein
MHWQAPLRGVLEALLAIAEQSPHVLAVLSQTKALQLCSIQAFFVVN